MDDTALPITDHLTELRSRLFKVILAWAIGTALAWSFAEEIFGYLLAPAITALGPEGGARGPSLLEKLTLAEV